MHIDPIPSCTAAAHARILEGLQRHACAPLALGQAAGSKPILAVQLRLGVVWLVWLVWLVVCLYVCVCVYACPS